MDGKKNKKTEQLEPFTRENEGKKMTTNTGVTISNDENTLTAGDRGPTLLEDFLMREKLAHFDRERIPERVVHVRGYGAHGIFELYESLEELTMAHFLQDPSKKTPLFVRFSEVAGSKGANETNRDVRGFAVKFYTEEGNFDLVGNNIPIFFIQDGIKFPDLIHALKPEPHNEIPQGQTAHDTFWDFIANNQESAAMMMWIMSDRAIPRSFRMMQGFGVHTFRLVNKNGKSRFVKFHWKPKLGIHSLIWDEAQKLGGALSIRYMSRYNGHRISKLVLVDAVSPSFVKNQESPYGVPKEQADTLINQMYANMPKFLNDVSLSFFNRNLGSATLEWFSYLGMQSASYALIKILQAAANEDVTKDLSEINVPTKIFHGVHDQLIPYKSAELTQKRIKNSQLHPLTNSGHGSPIDQADELNAELIKFLHS